MSRVFACARDSTSEQTTENQLRHIRAFRFNIEPKRVGKKIFLVVWLQTSVLD